MDIVLGEPREKKILGEPREKKIDAGPFLCYSVRATEVGLFFMLIFEA